MVPEDRTPGPGFGAGAPIRRARYKRRTGRAPRGDGNDRADFASFVDARAAALLRYAAILVPAPRAASDLTRQVLLAVSDDWDDVVAAGLEEEVRDRLARAACRSGHRSGRSGPGPVGDVPGLADQALAADTATPSPELVAALDRLAPLPRVVLVRRHVDGLTDDDIAARLALSVGEVGDIDPGVVPPRLLAPGLRVHEVEVPVPADPVGWVREARAGRTRRRLTVAVAVAVTVLVVGGLVVRQGAEPTPSDPVLASQSVAADDPVLLPWPAVGALVGDSAWLRSAVRAWQRTSPPEASPTGAVHPLLADTFEGVPVVVLEAHGAADDGWLAVVAGRSPGLVTVERLPARAPTSVVALRVPIVFATGGSAIAGDGLTDALLLGPQVLRTATTDRGPTGTASGRELVGWQRLAPADLAWTYQGGAGSASHPWLRLLVPPGGGAVVPLARDAADTVELDVAGAAGHRRATVWQVPHEEEPDLLLTADPLQIDQPPSRPFDPADYEIAADLWRQVDGGGPVTATFLSRRTTVDDVTLDLVQLQPSGTDQRLARSGDTLVVQRGIRDGRQVCLSSRRLSRFDADAYPFVVAACTYLLPSGDRRAVVLQGYSAGQTPSRFPVVVGVRTSRPSSTTVHRLDVGDLGQTRWLLAAASRPTRVSVTAVDSWNNLPPFVWRWRVGS